jgi:hypothetical protein
MITTLVNDRGALGQTAGRRGTILAQNALPRVELEEPVPIGTDRLSKVDASASVRAERIPAIAALAVPASAPPDARQRLVQTFLGEVIEVTANEFVAILKDQTDPRRPDERVEVSIDEVDEEDQSLLAPGAVFYWLILDEVRRGTRLTVTDLRFRRLPIWSKNELADVHRRGAERAERFGI